MCSQFRSNFEFDRNIVSGKGARAWICGPATVAMWWALSNCYQLLRGGTTIPKHCRSNPSIPWSWRTWTSDCSKLLRGGNQAKQGADKLIHSTIHNGLEICPYRPCHGNMKIWILYVNGHSSFILYDGRPDWSLCVHLEPHHLLSAWGDSLTKGMLITSAFRVSLAHLGTHFTPHRTRLASSRCREVSEVCRESIMKETGNTVTRPSRPWGQDPLNSISGSW